MGNGGARAKEAAHIDLLVLDLAEPNVSVGGEMHFEAGLQGDIAGMGFESKPAPAVFGGGRLAAGGQDGSLFGFWGHALAKVDDATQPSKFLH